MIKLGNHIETKLYWVDMTMQSDNNGHGVNARVLVQYNESKYPPIEWNAVEYKDGDLNINNNNNSNKEIIYHEIRGQPNDMLFEMHQEWWAHVNGRKVTNKYWDDKSRYVIPKLYLIDAPMIFIDTEFNVNHIYDIYGKNVWELVVEDNKQS